MTTKPPPGVIAILRSPNGEVVTTCCDFDASRPGGQPLLNAQRMRARRNLADAMVSIYCSAVIRPLMSSYAVTSLLDEAVKHGFRVEFVEVGHGQDAGDQPEDEN